MKVIVINGSPHGRKGNTQVILDPFMEGMKEAGAEVEFIEIKKLKIHPCQGCFKCWPRNGKCVLKDDMAGILAKLIVADIWVFATPLYTDGMTGQMKILIDRLLPTSDPYFVVRNGRVRHDQRPGVNTDGKLVLISNCGLFEKANFDPLVAHVKAYATTKHREYVGALLRPHGPFLVNIRDAMDDFKQKYPLRSSWQELGQSIRKLRFRGIGGRVKAVINGIGVWYADRWVKRCLAAAKKGGIETVLNGKISASTQRAVSRSLMPRFIFMKIINPKIADLIERMRAEMRSEK